MIDLQCSVELRMILSSEIVSDYCIFTLTKLVFTPLFLGASLFVPSADDIGTPGCLAKWMHKVEATVTHLTPGILLCTAQCSDITAMGQLLSTEATQSIPSLR